MCYETTIAMSKRYLEQRTEKKNKQTNKHNNNNNTIDKNQLTPNNQMHQYDNVQAHELQAKQQSPDH